MLCVLQAALDASAELQRPLNAVRVKRLVHVIERNKGWPEKRMAELSEILEDLRPVAFVELGKANVADNVPIILIVDTGDAAHARFGYGQSLGRNECLLGLVVLEPRR